MSDGPPPRGVRAMYGFGACFMGVPVMPVYVPYLHARGIATAGVLDLQAVFSLAVVLLDVPTGLLCDWLGRRRTLLLGALCNLAGAIGFAVAHGFASLVATELVLAAGWALVSGADVALLYDVLDTEAAGRDARRLVLGSYTLAQVVGEAVAGLAGGVLAGVSLPLVGWATAVAALGPVLIASIALPDGARRSGTAVATFGALPIAMRAVFGDRTTVLLFGNWIVWGLSTFVAVWLLQPYWNAQGVPLVAFGPLWAGTLLCVAGSSRLAPWVVRIGGESRALLLLAVLPVGAYAGMAAAGGEAGIAAGFGFYVSRGLNAVVLREAVNHRIPPALRATFNSVGSGFSRLGFAVVGPLVGRLVAGPGLRTALAVLAAAFGVALAALALPLWRRLRTGEARGST